MTTAYYLRVSTGSQDTKSQDADLKAHAATEANAVFYKDRFTGKTLERPGWSRLWADVLAVAAGSAWANGVGVGEAV
jgi:DNA invertase Pin-like site-specific DNA recombinase